jgi:hypothetical protein
MIALFWVTLIVTLGKLAMAEIQETAVLSIFDNAK